MGSLRNALTAGSTDFSASGLVSLGSGQVPGGFDQVAFYQHLVVRPCTLNPIPHTLTSPLRSAVPPQDKGGWAPLGRLLQAPRRGGFANTAYCQH